jgi:hypothetical protein
MGSWRLLPARRGDSVACAGIATVKGTTCTTCEPTAWRLGHLHADFAGRWEWTFGARRRSPALLVDFSPSASVALERFWALMDRWRDSAAAMTPEQLDTPGFGQYPWGSDPEEPFIGVLWEANLEFIHHMAEIALLRDLWRTRSPRAG